PERHPGFDGRSFRAALEGSEDAVEKKESLIFSNLGWPPEKNEADTEKARLFEYEPVAPEKKPALHFDDQLMGLRDEEHKLLWRPGYAAGAPDAVDGSVLIHIAQDPREDQNVLEQKPEVGREMRQKLAAWFECIKKEPHSYHNPVFAIGPDTSNVVFAFAPVRLRGQIINGVHCTENWLHVGDAAEYHINVRRAGDYRVRMDYKQLHRPGTRVRMSVGKRAIETTLEQSDGQELGIITLEDGQDLLKIEIMETPDSDAPIFEAFTRLSFEAI
ncbi:MAG: hypothetical protein ACOC29_04130, partial [Candidatus Sumerlaeota bacterium]